MVSKLSITFDCYQKYTAVSSEYQHIPSILGYSEDLCLRPANVSRQSGAKNGCALWGWPRPCLDLFGKSVAAGWSTCAFPAKCLEEPLFGFVSPIIFHLRELAELGIKLIVGAEEEGKGKLCHSLIRAVNVLQLAKQFRWCSLRASKMEKSITTSTAVGLRIRCFKSPMWVDYF